MGIFETATKGNRSVDLLQFGSNLLTSEKLAFFRTVFEQFDLEQNGTLSTSQLEDVLQLLGHGCEPKEISLAMEAVTGNSQSTVLNFNQFVALMHPNLLGKSMLPQLLTLEEEQNQHQLHESSPQLQVSQTQTTKLFQPKEPSSTCTIQINKQVSQHKCKLKPIKILYFVDILSIRAYIAQIKIQELKSTFKDQIAIDYHFVPIFGDAHRKLEAHWQNRGGLQGYSNYIQGVSEKFDHIEIHPEVWTKVTPRSSTACHLFLRAIHLLETRGEIQSDSTESIFEQAIAAFRQAFFQDLRDISALRVQWEIAKSLNLPLDKIGTEITNGSAYADLSRDFQLVQEHNVTISPTFIDQEGRQRFNGNVSYRIMEASIQELIYAIPNEESWY